MEVVKAPDSRLRVKTRPVKKITPGLLETIKQMVKLTKTFVDPEGVGLASTQVGKDEQYFVSKQEDSSFKVFFNPKILKYSKKTKLFFEGCLSIPNFWGEVTRPVWVEASYLNKQGEQIIEKLKGVDAWIFQHEVDHLNGKLFMDKVLEQKSKLFKIVGRDRTGAEIFEQVAL